MDFRSSCHSAKYQNARLFRQHNLILDLCGHHGWRFFFPFNANKKLSYLKKGNPTMHLPKRFMYSILLLTHKAGRFFFWFRQHNFRKTKLVGVQWGKVYQTGLSNPNPSSWTPYPFQTQPLVTKLWDLGCKRAAFGIITCSHDDRWWVG